MALLDLSKLKWTKNVKWDEDWAYQPYRNKPGSMAIPEARIFALEWKTDSQENAKKPQKGELILLHQRAKVTHIAEFLDNQVYQYQDEDKWVYRVVRSVWVPALCKDWNTLPHQKELFGFQISIFDGLAHNLEQEGKMPEFHQYWDAKGGLEAFQNFLASKLDR